MSDISKCLNLDCPLKDKCWRFTSPTDSLWQVYADFTYEITKDGKVECEYFWDNKGRKNEDYKDRI